MTKSRIALLVLTLAALTGVGFSATGSLAKAHATDDCGSCAGCASCCHK